MTQTRSLFTPPAAAATAVRSYTLNVRFGEVAMTKDDLAHWTRPRGHKTAAMLVRRGRASMRPVPFGPILVPELQDCVDRAAEYFSPDASLPLELFWTANRGVATFYTALDLGKRDQKGYLTFGSLGSLGEGVALYALEDRAVAPELFALDLMYRPLGDSPDMLMYRAADSGRLALVEAKATLSHQTGPCLTEAIMMLLEILKGWQNHRPLNKTDAFAVATSIHLDGEFHTDVIRLSWS